MTGPYRTPEEVLSDVSIGDQEREQFLEDSNRKLHDRVRVMRDLLQRWTTLPKNGWEALKYFDYEEMSIQKLAQETRELLSGEM